MQANFHLHPPKTGGSSIITALLEHSESFKEKYGHSYKVRIDSHHRPDNIPVDIGDTVTLSIREPYDRSISLLRMLNSDYNHNKKYTLSNLLTDAKRYSKLDSSIQHARFGKIFYPMWTVQSSLNEWEESVGKDCKVKLIRFENLVEDFQAIYPVELPHINYVPEPVPFSHIQENFDSQETLDKFNQRYEKDFDRYEYTMIYNINDLYHKYQNND